MPNSYKVSPRGGASSGSDSLSSSSISLSPSDGGSSSSSRSSTSSAPASVDVALKPRPTGALQRQPFVPPKILRNKNIPSVKKLLPRRAPLPDAGDGDGATGSLEPKAASPPSRKEQLAALQSQLLMSRAAIGQRWKEAWRSTESSAFSHDSDVDELEDLDSSDSSQAATPTSRKKAPAAIESSDNSSPMGTPLTASAAQRDLLQMLQRDLSSSSSELLHEESSQILNLTASDFIDDLKADFAPHESAEIRPSKPVDNTIMPRPLRKLKLRLFQGGHPTSSSSSDGFSDDSSDESQASVRWRQMPSRETSVPGELDGDLNDSEDEATEGEEEVEEHEGDEKEEEPDFSQPPGEEEEKENSGGKDTNGNGVAEEETHNEVSALESSATAEDEPQMIWKFEEPEEKPSPAQPKKTVVIRRPLKAADMAVDERLEADACQEDFDRREMVDRIIYEYTDGPLSPQMERLKAERVKLAEWARHLRDASKTHAEGERPAGYRPPLVRQPMLRGVGRTFPQTEVERPLTVDLSPRGVGIEKRLLQREMLPSTKVWQMEQRAKRLQQQTVQQQQQLELLQAALRKKIEASTNPAGSTAEGDLPVARSSTDTTEATEGLSPRSAELKLYEQQCVYLGAQLEEEHEFCEAYRAELGRVLLNNVALKKQHEDAVEALKEREAAERKERAEHLQAEEQLKDLQDRVEAETNRRLLEMSCRQQRDQQATTLQQRYAQLLHYLQEAEEKRSSFEDGLRVAQSKAQKAEALLQTKEAELAYAQRCLDTLDVQMLEKEVQRRKERDRANAAERQVEELKASLAAKEQEVFKLKRRSESSAALLEKEQQEHLKTREALAAAQATLKQQATEVQAPHLQIEGERISVSSAQRKLDSLGKLAKDFQALSAEAEAEEREMEAWHAEVEERRAKALSILEAAERSALSVLSQLDQGAADASAVSELSHQMEALRQARQEEVAALEHEFERAGKERKKLEADLEKREEEAANLRQEVASLSRKLQRQAQKNRRIARRIIRTSAAYGRSSRRTVCPELRTMRVGGVVEMLTKSASHRPEPRYIKMFKRGVVMWSEDLTGRRGFKKGDQFSVTDIIGIDFGTSSSAFLWSVHGAKGGKGSSPQFAYPWRCFTVRTLKDTFEFRAKSDEAAQDWVVGLGRLSSTHAPPMISDKHELVVHRVHMKLGAYAAQRGITPAVMWREAISRTSAQLPHLGQRAAAKGHRDSSEGQVQRHKDSTVSQRHPTHLHSDASPSRNTSPVKEHRHHTHHDRRREGHRRGPREGSVGTEQRDGQPGKQHSRADALSLPHNETAASATADPAPANSNTRSRSPRPKPRGSDARPDETLRRGTPSGTVEKGTRKGSPPAVSKDQREDAEGTDYPVSSPTPEEAPVLVKDKTRERANMQVADAKQSRRRRQKEREQKEKEEGTPAADGEYNSVKKISKGILSRAGTIFRKPLTKKTGE
ncbi:hypothetical protein, conserved [Eimeria praecox]|uniref:PH domain-containing protein n=1 Tax=Eimeria praecox TaxID=51316 RepID=U6H3Z9_9EIME|nr:hypothetical protein, conserved [Eimeria praecox]